MAFIINGENSNALITLIFIAIFAYATTKGILYGVLDPFINNSFLIEISSKVQNFQMNIFVVLAILIAILLYLIKKVRKFFTLSIQIRLKSRQKIIKDQ